MPLRPRGWREAATKGDVGINAKQAHLVEERELYFMPLDAWITIRLLQTSNGQYVIRETIDSGNGDNRFVKELPVDSAADFLSFVAAESDYLSELATDEGQMRWRKPRKEEFK